MPKSPDEHKIERESRVAFETLLGGRFVFRKEDPDYKVDGSAEEIDDHDSLTGLRFFVQLKATKELDLKKALAISGIPIEDRAYYRTLPSPVLMVRYYAFTRTIYTRWMHQYDPYYGHRGDKTFTFRWEESDVWDDNRAEQLIADARAFMELRSSSLQLPRPFYLVTDGAFGFPQTELLFTMRSVAERAADAIEVRGGAPAAGSALIEITTDEIKVNLAKVTGAVLHTNSGYKTGDYGERLAVDAWVLAAIAFANVGQLQIASRLVAAFAPDSSLLGSVEAAFSLQSIMAQARRVRESLEIATKLDNSDDPVCRQASVFFTMPAIYHGATLSESEFTEHRRTLEGRIQRRSAVGDRLAASREMVSLANFHRKRCEWKEAIRLYEEAVVADPGYRNRHHYWVEFGGVLFLARRFRESANAYGRGVALGGPAIARALQADALLFAGEYERARDIFANFNSEHPDQAAEYRLKKIALDAIVDGLGLTSQCRDTEAAVRAAPADVNGMSPDEVLEISCAQLIHDALWGSAWFNRGVAHHQQCNNRQAVADFLAASILMPGHDIEAWRNAILLAAGFQEAGVLVDILSTARRLAGPPLLTDLVEWSREQEARYGFPRERFLVLVERVLAEFQETYVPGFTMRLIDEEGRVNEISVSDGGVEPQLNG